MNETGSTSYVSDPLHPMEIPGTGFPGADGCSGVREAGRGAYVHDRRPGAPVEWTGRIRAELYLSSTAPDTDVIVRVSDVYPDGRSILIVDYPQRLRYREGFDHEVLMQPGEVVKVAFDVGWISQIFNKGHRIRVTVASTGAPLYEPNPQTGKPATIEFPSDAVSATNTIHHNRNHRIKDHRTRGAYAAIVVFRLRSLRSVELVDSIGMRLRNVCWNR